MYKVYLFLRCLRSYFINRFLYKLPQVDSSVHLRLGSNFSKDIIIGKYSYFGPGAWVCPKVSVGNYFMAAPNVCILGGDHRFNIAGSPIIFSGRPESLAPTLIGDDVWVGFGAIVNAGVSIGNGAVVAAGAIVTKDVPAYSIVGGNPAKFIRKRFNSEEQMLHEIMLRDKIQVGEYARKKKY